MRQREITDTLPLGILDRREDDSQRDEVEADDGFSLSASPSRPLPLSPGARSDMCPHTLTTP
jgi:hypothetical protein